MSVFRADDFPLGTYVGASSQGGNQANTVTLPAAATKTTYITGFEITGMGATAAAGIVATLTGLLGGNALNYIVGVPAGAGVPINPLTVEFDPPLPASAVNTAIVLTVPTFGAGNVAAAVAAPCACAVPAPARASAATAASIVRQHGAAVLGFGRDGIGSLSRRGATAAPVHPDGHASSPGASPGAQPGRSVQWSACEVRRERLR